MNEAVAHALAAHDACLAARGFVAWLGAEPTYTRRESTEDAWIGGALGGDKETAARMVLASLARELPGAALLRTVGRWYPEEDGPRFSYGLYGWRKGTPVWSGPPDPLLQSDVAAADDRAALDRLCDALGERLRAEGREVLRISADGSLPLRLCASKPGTRLHVDADDPLLNAPSPHAKAPEPGEPPDPLAARGLWLVRFRVDPADGHARVELPEVSEVDAFIALLATLAAAARDAALPALVIAGHPPPVDARVAFATLTPDPGVLEINMAPAADATSFYAALCDIERAATGAGLAPYRLHFNGEENDSGGGGQITFGGPSFAQSPFVREPRLLPRLVRYHLKHPALSYLFGWERMGSGSQSPRADESAPEALSELAVTLAGVERVATLDVDLVCASLAPFLSDRFGSSHRAEINVEKLAHTHGARNARLGLVELRALRMGPTQEHVAARAALLRALLAALSERDLAPEVTEWGAELHDRFALPYHLERDLSAVLADLERVGVGLGAPLTERLVDDGHRLLAQMALGEASLRVRAALEFPPLVGDQGDQQATSRLVDASTQRVELWVRDAGPDGWTLCIDGLETPLPREGADHVLGVRRRAYWPAVGVHPWLRPREPLTLVLCDLGRDRAFEVTLHAWRPDGSAYPGLPATREEARERRAERVCVRDLGPASRLSRSPLATGARSPHAVDTRHMEPPTG